MIKNIRSFFKKHFADTDTPRDTDHQLMLASATLLVEITCADDIVTESEENALNTLLSEHFTLTAEETSDLLDLARSEKQAATDYYRFTSLLNEHYSQQQKIQLIEYLWRLAYADEALDKFEEHLIRRLADLLHVPHADFIQSKHKVMGNR